VSAFWRGRRVLVTGHTGFKGAWLCQWLALRGARITGLALDPPTRPALWSLLGLGDVDDLRGDVCDAGAVASAVLRAEPEIVFHLAAQALVRPSYALPVETFAANLMGTVHLLDAVRRHPGVRAVVVVTTDKCYANREWLWGYREDEALGGRDPYSASKACAEIATAAFRDSFFSADGAARVATARAGNVIGGGDWAPERLVPDILAAFGKGDPVVLRRPRAVRPWQHVLDPLAGYLLLAERLAARDPAAAEAFNFGPPVDSAVEVAEVARRLQRHFGGGQVEVAAAADGPHEAGLLRLDPAKARARLGWQPRLDLDTALQWTAAWYRGWLDDPTAAADLTRGQIERYEAIAPARSADG